MRWDAWRAQCRQWLDELFGRPSATAPIPQRTKRPVSEIARMHMSEAQRRRRARERAERAALERARAARAWPGDGEAE
jgi:hypothetical protein